MAGKEGDATHFNERGARAMAEPVVRELPAAEPRLREYLKAPRGAGRFIQSVRTRRLTPRTTREVNHERIQSGRRARSLPAGEPPLGGEANRHETFPRESPNPPRARAAGDRIKRAADELAPAARTPLV